MGKDKILFVDDEQNLLDGIRRNLGVSYNIAIALGGMEGINAIEKDGPFAVVVSDMRMPIVDGVQFLGIVKKCAPETVRIMLTGNTDLDTAMNAVNEGNIFRFITKPCSREILEKTLNASIEQHHLIRAEHDLLENTLQGGIKVLVDILALVNPIAFGKAKRIKYHTTLLARALNLPDIWRIELAAMFSQIGCVTIPPDTLDKMYTNQNLSPIEKKMLENCPKVAHDLIVNIPRLEPIAKMILHQKQDFSFKDQEETFEIEDEDPVVIGSAILHVAIDYDTLLTCGLPKYNALKKLNENEKAYDPRLLSILKKLRPPNIDKKFVMMRIDKLHKGMILGQDVLSKHGLLLVPKGQEITSTVHILLNNYYKRGNIDKRILVSIPEYV